MNHATTHQDAQKHFISSLRVLRALVAAEWVAGIFGLRLFIACVAIATFMMGAVWMLGDGLSSILARGGTTFLGGDVAVTTTNVPLEKTVRDELEKLGDLSTVVELRSSAWVNDSRLAVEVKGVDNVYPLYSAVGLGSGRALDGVFNLENAMPPVVVEPSLLARTEAEIGDTLRLGEQDFRIVDVLKLEPDRLSAGRFMVGPRLLVPLADLEDNGLIQRGSIVEYRYRLRKTAQTPSNLVDAVRALRPEIGWELETPDDAGDRVLRTVNRTTTFLGVAGIIAFAIGLSGAWAATKSWIRRRTRTIALYRLSGALPGMIMALHGVIVAFASFAGLFFGLVLSAVVALPLLDMITAQLHVEWVAQDLYFQLLWVIFILTVGLVGTSLLALSSAADVSPGAAMRSGEAPLQLSRRHAVIGFCIVSVAVISAAFSLPIPKLATMATVGLGGAMVGLALAAFALSKSVARLSPRGFIATVICQNLSNAGQTATRTVAIGIGIVGITAIVAAQNSLGQALLQELPERIPDLVLIDVQPSQVEDIRARIEADADLGGLQADPFMRMTITAINGVPAHEALRRDDKAWVIEGDRSFSWTAEPTGAELLAGEWWAVDYDGPTLVSPEEDMMEAFDLKVGDTLTYSVLGRAFTSQVANIRKEYHRTFRPEYLMMASPNPFKDAPHTWILSLQGKTDVAINTLMRDLAVDHSNVTSIDIRQIVTQVQEVIDGAMLASALMALILVVSGTVSVAALVASDVDSRRQESLVFSLVGASRREIAVARLLDAAGVGGIAAVIGGLAGSIVGYFIVSEGLHVDWAPGYMIFVLPLALGVMASLMSGIVGGLGAAPRGRGQMVRQLTS